MSNNLRNTLYQRKDIAQEVGWLIMYAANLEAFLAPTLAVVVGCNVETARAMTQKIDNISAKLSMVEAVATLRKGEAKADVVLDLMKDITAGIALRNKLAHSLYGINMQDDMFIVTNVITDRRGKPTYERLSPRSVHATVEKLRAALERLEREVMPPLDWKELEALARASQAKRALASQKQGTPPRGRKAP